jgi:hypothetical protein
MASDQGTVSLFTTTGDYLITIGDTSSPWPSVLMAASDEDTDNSFFLTSVLTVANNDKPDVSDDFTEAEVSLDTSAKTPVQPVGVPTMETTKKAQAAHDPAPDTRPTHIEPQPETSSLTNTAARLVYSVSSLQPAIMAKKATSEIENGRGELPFHVALPPEFPNTLEPGSLSAANFSYEDIRAEYNKIRKNIETFEKHEERSRFLRFRRLRLTPVLAQTAQNIHTHFPLSPPPQAPLPSGATTKDAVCAD